MVIRLTTFNIASNKATDAKRMYNEEVIPEVKKQNGNAGVMLLEAADGSGEFISSTHWKTKADADAYEASGKYKELVDKLKGFFTGQPSIKTYNTAD